ncbi:2'-5' RNA ligase family protein [Nonomuraea sp. NPDC005650]|uniref:2'-5' RNA ligase family protein n=1 Tax=Nonomuraea sp. NPDC005650 TaxID=3157045 RepID=UPI0033A2226A
MDRFIQGNAVWPEGITKLHVYLVPDLELNKELAALVQDCRAVIGRFPGVQIVPDAWLKATLQLITGVTGAEIGAQEREALGEALAAALAEVEPFTLSVGPALAGATGVALDLDQDLPGQRLHECYERVRAAVVSVLGTGSVEYSALPPHLTLGYGLESFDSGPVQEALRRQVRPGRATWLLNEVWLVEVTQDVADNQYRWLHPACRIQLGLR